jgi:hypothetical protein
VCLGVLTHGASLTAARLQLWGTDLGLTACVPRGTDSAGWRAPDRRVLANRARRGTNVEQATPGDAGSRAENLRLGPVGRTRAGDPGAGTLAEPQGARARNAWLPWRTLWSGCFAEHGAKARVAGGSGGRPGHAETRLARDPLAGTLVARLGSAGGRPNATRTHPTARGALTARVPRGTDSDGAHPPAVRLLTARVGVLTWDRRPQAMPGRGPRTCSPRVGPRVAPEQATPGRARWKSTRAPGPGSLGAARWSGPTGAGRLPEPLGVAVCRPPDGPGPSAGPGRIPERRVLTACVPGVLTCCVPRGCRPLDRSTTTGVRSPGDGRTADAVVMEAAEIRRRRSCWAVPAPSAAGIRWVTGLRCHFSPMGLGPWCAGRARHSGSSLPPSGL